MFYFIYLKNKILIYQMKTDVLMIRDLDGIKVQQRSKDKFLNATALLSQYNSQSGKNKVMSEFWSNKGTEDFLESLARELNDNIGNSLYLEKDLYTTTRGKNGGTFMHPYLFVKFAMWLSSDFEVKVIKWVYDNLIDFRNQAGDHYLEMREAIQNRYIEHFKKKPNPLVFIKEANFLNKLVYGEYKGQKRNLSSEEQLDKLNKLQVANIKLINQKISLFDRKEKLREFSELL